MRELIFKDLQVDNTATSHKNLLILQEVEGGRQLSLELGPMEGMAISLVLHAEPLPRPLTHDLILLCLKALHAQFTQAEITSYRDGMFYAVIELRQERKRIRIDCRPSDALTLALRTNSPIFIASSILDELCGTEPTSQNELAPLYIPDAATEMVKRASAGHALDILNADPLREADSLDENDPAQKERLKELLRCLEPATRHKM